MRIRLRDIQPCGLKINDTIPLTPLNRRMDEGWGNDIYFLEDPEVQLTIHKTPLGAEVRGSVKTRYKQPCALCLDQFTQPLEVKIQLILKPKDGPSSLSNCDDVGIMYYEGEHVELEDHIQETLILALSPYLKPPKTCTGACSVCGLNFGESYAKEMHAGNSFGQLLKAAGVKRQ